LLSLVVLGSTGLVSPPAYGQAGPVLEAFDTGGLEAKSAALILSGQEGGELAVSALAVPVPAQEPGGKGSALLQVDIEGASLLEGVTDEKDIIVEIYAYALAKGGAVGGFLGRAFRIDMEEHGAEVARRGVKFLGGLDLPPGEYALQVLTRQRRSDRFSLQSLPLRVAASGEDPATGPILPLFPEDPSRWLRVQTTDAQEGQLAALPWTIAGGAVVPSTFPVVRSDQAASFLLLGSSLEGRLKARFLDLERNPVQDVTLEDGGAATGLPVPLEAKSLTLAPTGLRPGQYFLEITNEGAAVSQVVPGDGGKRLETLEDKAADRVTTLPIVVLPPDVGDDLPLWSQLRGGGEELAQAKQQEELSIAKQRQRIELSRWLSAYREALLDGPLGRTANPKRLTELEFSQLAEKGHGGARKRGVDQITAAKYIGDERPESLVPLIRYHEWRYRQHHESHSYQLATHSRQMALALAETYVALSGSEGSKRIAAANLISIAGYLQEVGSIPSALGAFEKALDYDKQNVAALLGIGTILEADLGDYEGAVSAFRKLLRLQPKNVEVRLRLAVNQARTGHAGAAEKNLRACISGRSPAWVKIVANQELGNLLASKGKHGEAAEILQSAITRFPGQQRLYIQLASVYDSLNRPSAAREALERMDPKMGRRRPSPRLVYWRKPTWAIDQSRQFLEENAQNRMPVLADTLMALVPEKGTADAGS